MRIKESRGDQIFNVAVYILLTACALIVIYPLIFVVSASFSTPAHVISGRVWLYPVEPTLMAYRAVFENRLIMSGYANTIFYVITGTLISLTITICAAYPLSRKNMVGRSFVTKLFIFATLFSGGLIPFYLVVQNLGLVNTRASIVVPGALSVFHMILMRTHIMTAIPEEMLEAAEIDGCSHFQRLFLMVLPLSGSIIAILTLFSVVALWNSFFFPLIFLLDQTMFPLQLILRDILIMQNIPPEMMATVDVQELMLRQGLQDVLRYSLIVVSSFPLLVAYPFVQKYFVKGVMMGSMKG